MRRILDTRTDLVMHRALKILLVTSSDFLQQCVQFTELYVLRSELSWRKLSPTLATTTYSSPDNPVIGLVAQSELSGYVKLG